MFNKTERRFDIGANVGFIDGTGLIWFIGVFTVVDEGLFTVADVTFSFAWAKIWATSGDNLSSDNDERVDAIVEVGGALFGVESTSLADDPWLTSDDDDDDDDDVF
jgi:hypothetical protein